jgi:hypothetical protein
MFSFRSVAVAAAASGALALVGLGAPAAFAGTTPPVTPAPLTTPYVTPTPAVTPHFIVTPPPVHHPVLRPEQFNILQTENPNFNIVSATGPVSGHGFDITNTPTRDTLRLGGLNSVKVNHSPVGLPTINLGDCTATITQTGVWSFAGGTGADVHATGHGLFNLVALAAFANRPNTNTCSLTGLNVFQVQRDILGTGTLRPSVETLAVHGAGVASR